MRNVFLYLLIVALSFGCNADNMSAESNEQKKNCLTIESFNSIADHIKTQGKQIKLSERLIADKASVSLEISVGNRFIELEDYQGYKRIIVIDKTEDNKIPAYFVANKNNEVLISAYNSRFDVEKDVKTRTEDWCIIISEVTEKK